MTAQIIDIADARNWVDRLKQGPVDFHIRKRLSQAQIACSNGDIVEWTKARMAHDLAEWFLKHGIIRFSQKQYGYELELQADIDVFCGKKTMDSINSKEAK